jgi:hypothetical protein
VAVTIKTRLVLPLQRQFGSNWNLFYSGTTAVAAVVITVGVMKIPSLVRKELAEQNKMLRTSNLYKEYPDVAKCMAEIGYFYQDRQRAMDDAQKKPESARTRPDVEAIAEHWAQEKRSKSQKPPPEVRIVDGCRQITANFFKNAYMLLDKNLVDKSAFEESFYARSGNFKRLVEPLDKANFDVINQNPNQTYMYGNNRPGIYVRIEKAEKEPALQEYF